MAFPIAVGPGEWMLTQKLLTKIAVYCQNLKIGRSIEIFT
jgi:hypothetical protein